MVLSDGFLLIAKDILSNPKLKIIRGSMQDAVSETDVVIGFAIAQAFLRHYSNSGCQFLCVLIVGGDYYNMSQTNERKLIADNPADLGKNFTCEETSRPTY